MDKLKQIIDNILNNGIKFPYAFDGVTKQPSITLFFTYVSFTILCFSLAWLHFDNNVLMGTVMSMATWALATVFYLMRQRLKSFKLDLDKKSIELEGDKNE